MKYLIYSLISFSIMFNWIKWYEIINKMKETEEKQITQQMIDMWYENISMTWWLDNNIENMINQELNQIPQEQINELINDYNNN